MIWPCTALDKWIFLIPQGKERHICFIKESPNISGLSPPLQDMVKRGEQLRGTVT